MFNYYHQFYFAANGSEPEEVEIQEGQGGETSTTVVTPEPVSTLPINRILVGENGELNNVTITSIVIHALPKTTFKLDDAEMVMNNTGKFEWTSNCNIKFLQIGQNIPNDYPTVIDITYVKNSIPAREDEIENE